ncbi:MAG: PD-(D/E)XK nuclease-like domain-containing protein [Bacillota bacterium]|nr:PD-(D/E)XK nuclease-like domain-containing protein [Bacillota bacterium]
MKQINLKDFTVTPIEESAHHEKISDELYFQQYNGYVTASKMHRISPRRNGSMQKYYNPEPIGFSEALTCGTAVHAGILEPDDFTFHDKCNKPTGKLGGAVDAIVKYRKQGMTIAKAIEKGCDEVSYYMGNENLRIKKLRTKQCLSYYLLAKETPDNCFLLSDKMYDTVTNCISSISKNRIIQKQLHPVDEFCDPLPSFCEECFYQDFHVTYKDKEIVLHVKGKIDNYTVDPDRKILVLNDVKTSSDPLLETWMDAHFSQALCYQTQFALYMTALQNLAKKDYGFDDTWRCKAHVWAVQTRGNYFSRCYVVSDDLMEDGKKVYEECLKRIAYYEIFGHEEEVEFID